MTGAVHSEKAAVLSYRFNATPKTTTPRWRGAAPVYRQILEVSWFSA
jgi:hypothetical protein